MNESDQTSEVVGRTTIAACELNEPALIVWLPATPYALLVISVIVIDDIRKSR